MHELLAWLAERQAATLPAVAARERLAALRLLRECPDGLPAAGDDAGWAALLARARAAGGSPPAWLRRGLRLLRAFQRDQVPAAATLTIVEGGGVRGEIERELEGLPGSLERAVRDALDRAPPGDEDELGAAVLVAARVGVVV